MRRRDAAAMTELKVLHTSDVHIGAPFLFLGERGPEQRRALRDALARVTRLAREENYDALLVAGDLFDSAFQTSEADVSFAVGCCAGAGPRCQVVILPGSHDFYAAGSVFERERARFEASGNVHILTPERRAIEFPDLSLAVHGSAMTSPHSAEGVWGGLAPLKNHRWNICLAHGSIAGYSAADPGETSLRLDELEAGFDYVALGHWHSYLVVKEKRPAVVYSGSPEVVDRDQVGAGSAVSISLAAEGATFNRAPIGKRRIEEVAVDCTGIATTEELVKRVLSAAAPDENLIVGLALTGLIGPDATLDPDQAAAQLEASYFSVKLSGKGPARQISKGELLAVPEDTIAGKFVRVMLRRIDTAEGERRELLEEALQLGFQLFKGRDVIG